MYTKRNIKTILIPLYLNPVSIGLGAIVPSKFVSTHFLISFYTNYIDDNDTFIEDDDYLNKVDARQVINNSSSEESVNYTKYDQTTVKYTILEYINESKKKEKRGFTNTQNWKEGEFFIVPEDFWKLFAPEIPNRLKKIGRIISTIILKMHTRSAYFLLMTIGFM